MSITFPNRLGPATLLVARLSIKAPSPAKLTWSSGWEVSESGI